MRPRGRARRKTSVADTERYDSSQNLTRKKGGICFFLTSCPCLSQGDGMQALPMLPRIVRVQPLRMALYLGKDPLGNRQPLQQRWARARWRKYYQNVLSLEALGLVKLVYVPDRPIRRAVSSR